MVTHPQPLTCKPDPKTNVAGTSATQHMLNRCRYVHHLANAIFYKANHRPARVVLSLMRPPHPQLGVRPMIIGVLSYSCKFLTRCMQLPWDFKLSWWTDRRRWQRQWQGQGWGWGQWQWPRKSGVQQVKRCQGVQVSQWRSPRSSGINGGVAWGIPSTQVPISIYRW